MTVIEISDDKAAALQAKAAAEGLTLKQWLENLASDRPAASAENDEQPLPASAKSAGAPSLILTA